MARHPIQKNRISAFARLADCSFPFAKKHYYSGRLDEWLAGRIKRNEQKLAEELDRVRLAEALKKHLSDYPK